jgi:hypothetical protein
MLIYCTAIMLNASHDTAIKQFLRNFIPARHVDLILQTYAHVIVFKSAGRVVPKVIREITYGPCSSVGIASELRAGRSGDRIPVRRGFIPVQTGPEAHPASCTMGSGSLPEVKYGRVVLLTTHPLLVPRSWKSRAIPLPTL